MKPKDLASARKFAALPSRNYANNINSIEFASHVTEETKLKIKAKKLKWAEEVEAGLHDGNFTVAQRMHYYLTGEEIGFLAK